MGDSTARLAKTALGKRIEFRLGYDPLAALFSNDAFDAVVFAHCSWYFASEEVLLQTLRQVHPWARRLLFSEWDLEPATLDQTAHLLAVTIQSQTEAFKPASEANVRTPLSRSRTHGLLEQSGWHIVREAAFDTSGLDDGRWEIDACLGASFEGLHPACERRSRLKRRPQGLVVQGKDEIARIVRARCGAAVEVTRGSMRRATPSTLPAAAPPIRGSRPEPGRGPCRSP